MTTRWEDSRVQFARLLCEIGAALDEGQTKALIKDLSASMDLSADDVIALFDRAEEIWDLAKQATEVAAVKEE